MQILENILEHKLISIVRGVPESKMLKTVEALEKGGVYALEITFCHQNEDGIESTLRSLKMIRDEMGDRILLGAGTVLTPEQAELAIQAGAMYIVSPNTDTAVIRHTKKLGAISIPGAFTPSEAVEAHAAGADIVKLFPAGLLGAAYFRAMRAPLPHIRFCAVGGVNASNAAEFIKSGACCLGVGESLTPMDAIEAGDFSRITQISKKLADAIAGL